MICLKRSVASSTFVGLRSGWYMRASFLNVFLMDASSAVSGSPRALRCFVLADCAMVDGCPSTSLWGSPSVKSGSPRLQACSHRSGPMARAPDRSIVAPGPWQGGVKAALHRPPLGSSASLCGAGMRRRRRRGVSLTCLDPPEASPSCRLGCTRRPNLAVLLAKPGVARSHYGEGLHTRGSACMLRQL